MRTYEITWIDGYSWRYWRKYESQSDMMKALYNLLAASRTIVSVEVTNHASA